MKKESQKKKKENIEESIDMVEITEELADNQSIYDEYLDDDYTRGIIEKVINPINKVWFRSEMIGWEDTPKRNNPKRPIIFATNHSGMAFPWDAMIFGYRHTVMTNYSRDSIRAITAPMLSKSALMNPFTIPKLWWRIGAIDATFFNFETMMYYNKKNVLVYPEGVPGIGKGFNKKYQLQELKTSFLRMSIKYKTDIIPFFCINGEYINPFSYNSKFITKLVNIIGIPFLPLGFITPFILIQPWIFYFAFPAKLTFILGKRIRPFEMIKKPYDKITQDEFKKLSSKIRIKWQKQLSEGVKKYGKKPWDIKNLFRTMIKNFKLLPYAFPTSWVILFHEYERLYKKHGNSNFDIKLGFLRNFLIIIRIPFLIFYFIPILGLIPIAIRGYKGNSIKKKKN